MTHLLNYDITMKKQAFALALNGRLYAFPLKNGNFKSFYWCEANRWHFARCLLKTRGLRKKYFRADYFTNQANLI